MLFEIIGMSSFNRIINEQPDETWSELGKKLMRNSLDYNKTLHSSVIEYFDNKAKSIGTNIGYVIMTAISAVHFMLANKKSMIQITDIFKTNPNILKTNWYIVI